MTYWLNHIQNLSRLIDSDPQLFAYAMRDLDITQEAGLKDLCWSMCSDAYVHKNDALFLKELLEKYIKENE